jgi:hypothetical protein
VEVHEVSIDRLTITKSGSDYLLARLNGRLSSDAAAHVLALSAARTPFGTLQGNVRLGTAQPFPLNGTLDLSQAEATPTYQVKALLWVFGNCCGMPQYIVVIESKLFQGTPL